MSECDKKSLVERLITRERMSAALQGVARMECARTRGSIVARVLRVPFTGSRGTVRRTLSLFSQAAKTDELPCFFIPEPEAD